MSTDIELGLSQAELQALRTLLARSEAAATPAPVVASRAESLADVKENLQATGDHLFNAWTRLRIPVRVYQRETTAERRSGYYIAYKTLEEFLEFVGDYYMGYPNSEPHQHITALLNAIILFREDQLKDRDNLYLAINQYGLLQEREVQRAIATELQRMRTERDQQVAAHVLPEAPEPPSGPVAERVVAPRATRATIEESRIDLTADAPAPDTSRITVPMDDDQPRKRGNKRGEVTDDEDLDADGEDDFEE